MLSHGHQVFRVISRSSIFGTLLLLVRGHCFFSCGDTAAPHEGTLLLSMGEGDVAAPHEGTLLRFMRGHFSSPWVDGGGAAPHEGTLLLFMRGHCGRP